MNTTRFFRHTPLVPRLAVISLLLAVSAGFASGCDSSSAGGSSNDDAGDATCSGGGGPVPGADDLHCSDSHGDPIIQPISTEACTDSDAGAESEGDGGVEEEEQLTLFNAEGDDDDCKYHVSFSSSCVEQNKDVTLTVHVNKRTSDSSDGSGGPALVGADTKTEIYLSDTHLAPNTHPTTKVVSPGVYTIGPVRFDRAGRWTVRFHFFEDCLDAREDSPHGHAAFYLNVP